MKYTLEGKLKKQNKVLKYALMFLQSLFFALLLTILIGIIIGFRPVQINGGSMLPTLEYNDIIVIYKPKKEQIKEGDILTFKEKSGQLCTHRIVKIDENGYYYTKGDNPLNSPDGYPISYEDNGRMPVVVGITIYRFHVVGQVISWLIVLPNLIAFALCLCLLGQANRGIKEIFDKYSEYLV